MKTKLRMFLFVNLIFMMTSKIQAQSNSFNFEKLYGQWHILYSNFPMWTSGSRTSPSLNYSKNENSKVYFINDVVKFRKGGKPKTIKGYNKVLSEEDLTFQWKGAGILSLLRSRWQIVHFADEWMIIKFEKTLFTPEGYDVVSKTIDLKPHQIQAIERQIKLLSIQDLLPIPHQE